MAHVKHILEAARKRLAILDREAQLADAAAILANPNTPLIVVCDSEGVAVGVVSKSNIIRAFTGGKADVAGMNLGDVMTSPVLSCDVEQALKHVWDTLNASSLRSIPVIDDSGRPQGIVHARDLARALLDEVDEEELLLRDYVLGIGYQ
jgi:CBS domain-containing protein